MASKPTQVEAQRHVVYEIEAMTIAAVRYGQEWDERLNQATPNGFEDAVFFLEAALIHARTIVMTFGFPDDKAHDVLDALQVPTPNDAAAFRLALAPIDVAGRVYGLLSELLAHIGAHRWEAPVGIAVHQPVLVAATVLDAVVASGATANPEVGAAVTAGQQRLAPYL